MTTMVDDTSIKPFLRSFLKQPPSYPVTTLCMGGLASCRQKLVFCCGVLRGPVGKTKKGVQQSQAFFMRAGSTNPEMLFRISIRGYRLQHVAYLPFCG